MFIGWHNDSAGRGEGGGGASRLGMGGLLDELGPQLKGGLGSVGERLSSEGAFREPITKEEFLRRHPWARKGVQVLDVSDQWIVVNKPPGWLTIPDRWVPTHPNLYGWLKKRYGEEVYVVHRLDWEVSGVNLFARTREVHRLWNIAFQYRCVRKVYLALVEGTPEEPEGKIELRLTALSKRKRNVYKIGGKEGKPAVTYYRLLRRYLGYSLLQVEPLTGRTHQIRVHLKAIGLPVVGDRTYGGHVVFARRLKPGRWYTKRRGVEAEEEKPLVERAFLHAWLVGVPAPDDPAYAKMLWWQAPLFKDLKVTLRYLERYRRVEEEGAGYGQSVLLGGGDSSDVDRLIEGLAGWVRAHPLYELRSLKHVFKDEGTG